MYKYLPITDVYAREILDSRGNPTIEVEVLAGDEFCGRFCLLLSNFASKVSKFQML